MATPRLQKVTIKDIARTCNVSTQTVSRVLNNRADVAPETRTAVEKAIAELGYQPSALARSLVQQRSYTLGVIIAGLKYSGVSLTLNGITEQCEAFGYSLLLKELGSFEVTDIVPIIRQLIASHVEGIIFAAPEIGNNVQTVQSQLPNICSPIVFLKAQRSKQHTTVGVDNYDGARQATEHLLKVGRKQIGLICGPLEWLEARQRKQGWADALTAAGETVSDKRWVMGNWSSRSGEAAFAELVEKYPEMDAVFASNDQMALGVLHYASSRGVRVPDDLAVVGFDDLPEAAYFTPALTTVRHPLRELGMYAVTCLLEQINGAHEAAPEQMLTLQTELVVRDSTPAADPRMEATQVATPVERHRQADMPDEQPLQGSGSREMRQSMERNNGNDSRKATAATVAKAIERGRTTLGVELGSTRIKAVLIGEDHKLVASGSHEWENRFEHGVWTYHLEDVWTGLQDSYRKLSDEVFERYGVRLTAIGAIGISAMMHGYLAFDSNDNLLAPFRTWRNTSTGQAAEKLTALFGFNIPQRWSIAHLYQAILNREPHIADVRYLTTLAGYVHWKLTGQKVLGVGEASGMFPIDSTTNTGAALPREHSSYGAPATPGGRGRQEPIGRSRAYSYDKRMAQLFNRQPDVEVLPWKLQRLLPEVLVAGDIAGALTEAGAALIDPTGQLRAGIPLCPPEGDAGTGMVATNSVRERTGNVSAGTSVFAMIVLERALSKLYPEIDMVTTPAGKPVAMVHSNNCTSDLNAWAGLFSEFTRALGVEISQSRLFELLYKQALAGDADCGGLLAFNYLSGEHITHFEEGRPLFVRTPESRFTLANFMRVHLFSALGALKIGMDILVEQEKVQLDQVLAHGGFFKTPEVGQRIMAAALNVPVSVMETAGEGGAWGSALLAAYMLNRGVDEPLEEYLSRRVFAEEISTTVAPSEADVEGYRAFMERYQRGLVIERSAVDALK